MDGSLLGEAQEMLHFDAYQMAKILVRIGVAALFGAFVAFRPWVRWRAGAKLPKSETCQAQTLIAVVGALMVVVIGESLPRAFGLVGLGGVIRFRSGIKDPRDAAIMFIMIGIGMASGLGQFSTTVLVTIAASVILAVFDLTGSAMHRCFQLTIPSAQAGSAIESIQKAFPMVRVSDALATFSDKQISVLAISATEGEDAGRLTLFLEALGASRVVSVAIEKE